MNLKTSVLIILRGYLPCKRVGQIKYKIYDIKASQIHLMHAFNTIGNDMICILGTSPMLNGPNTASNAGPKMPAANGQLNRYPPQPQPNMPPYSVGSYPLPQQPPQQSKQPQPHQPGMPNALNQPLQRPPISSNGEESYFDEETGKWTMSGPSAQGQFSKMQSQGPPPKGKLFLLNLIPNQVLNFFGSLK